MPRTPTSWARSTKICSGRMTSVTGPSRRLGEDDLAQGARGPVGGGGAREHHGAADELGHLRVAGGEVDLVGRGRLDESTGAHHRDLVGQGERLVLVVGDQQGGGVGERQGTAYGSGGAAAQARVEGRERLVEQYDGGPGRQGAGECDALLLAAGELVGTSRAEVGGQLDQVEHLGDPVTAVRVPALLAAEAEGDVAGHVEVREQRALLGDVAHPAGLGRHRPDAVAGHHGVAEGDGARLGLEEAGDQPQQRGLPAPGGAEHGRERAVRDVQGDGVDGRGRPEAPGHVGDAHAAHAGSLS